MSLNKRGRDHAFKIRVVDTHANALVDSVTVTKKADFISLLDKYGGAMLDLSVDELLEVYDKSAEEVYDYVRRKEEESGR